MEEKELLAYLKTEARIASARMAEHGMTMEADELQNIFYLVYCDAREHWSADAMAHDRTSSFKTYLGHCIRNRVARMIGRKNLEHSIFSDNIDMDSIPSGASVFDEAASNLATIAIIESMDGVGRAVASEMIFPSDEVVREVVLERLNPSPGRRGEFSDIARAVACIYGLSDRNVRRIFMKVREKSAFLLDSK